MFAITLKIKGEKYVVGKLSEVVNMNVNVKRKFYKDIQFTLHRRRKQVAPKIMVYAK